MPFEKQVFAALDLAAVSINIDALESRRKECKIFGVLESITGDKYRPGGVRVRPIGIAPPISPPIRHPSSRPDVACQPTQSALTRDSNSCTL